MANNSLLPFLWVRLRLTQRCGLFVVDIFGIYMCFFLGGGGSIKRKTVQFKHYFIHSRLSLALNKAIDHLDHMWHKPLKEVNQANISLVVLDKLCACAQRDSITGTLFLFWELNRNVIYSLFAFAHLVHKSDAWELWLLKRCCLADRELLNGR